MTDNGSFVNYKMINGLLDSFKTIGQIIYGATFYEMLRDLKKERAQLERLFILTVFGEFLGVPILPPYFALRLLPYVVPQIDTWKTGLLREHDIIDNCDQEIT